MAGLPALQATEMSSRQEQLIHAACKRIVSAVHFHDAQGVYEYLARAINVLHCTD